MSDYNNANFGQDAASVLQGFIEAEKLKKWQKHFCDVANVFICCLDSTGAPLTEFGGKRDEIDQIIELVGKERFHDILLRVSQSELEDQTIETTEYPNLRIAAVSAKVEGKPVLNWLVCGIISDVQETEEYHYPPLTGFSSTLSEVQFIHVVDALRDFTNALLRYRLSIVTAEAESRRSRSSAQELSENLHRSEAITDVVQLLENEDAIENVMARLLEIVVKFLGISGGAVYRLKDEPERIEVVTSWSRNKASLNARMESRIQGLTIFKPEKTLVISSNSVAGISEKEVMTAIGLKAMVVIPITINNIITMYVCFGEVEQNHIWSLEEVKFINDATKILQSILARRIQKNSLASSYASLETILDNVGSAVYVRDIETKRVLFANSNLRHTFEAELKNGTLDALLDQGIQGEKGIAEIFHEKREHWYDLYYTQMKWVDGSSVLLCALYDITDKKLYQRRIEQQAYTDFLTGLYNRMCCERDLAKYIDIANTTNRKGALLYLDLDDFKHINDGLGHQYGDVLLKAISHSLQRINGIENTCYRMGGDEFVIIVPPDSFEKFEQVISSIREIFMKPWFLKDADYYCTMSMGIVEFPDSGIAVHDLIKKADIAMYEAKRGGKNRITQYEDNLDSKSGKRLDMEKNMREATAAGYHEFEVYFQPINDIRQKDNKCTGAEALIRWNSSELGFISPAEFIPLAEYLGLINPIGNYVLYEACRICRSWNDNGYPDYHVNVNLSVVQLLQANIVEIVQEALLDTGIRPYNLTLEVTESLAINDLERMKEILGRIKKLGVKIALDDFGTGYSSLNHIREIPVDVIKVDQSFIKDLERDAYAKSFIRMVAELADAIGVDICVEGVETAKQLDILKHMGADYVQGYYFDRPMPRKDFEEKYLPDMGK